MFGATFFGKTFFAGTFFAPPTSTSGGGGGGGGTTSGDSERARLTTFYGQAGGPRIIQGRKGARDLGLAYPIYAKSRVLAPAGVDGESLFTALYLTVTWTATVTFRVTPIVDGVPYDGVDATDERKTLTVAARPTRKTQTFVVPLSRRLVDPRDSSVVMSRFYLRGGRFQMLIESIGALGEGDFILENAVVEVEVMTDTKGASA
jgi:hypothetical protein